MEEEALYNEYRILRNIISQSIGRRVSDDISGGLNKDFVLIKTRGVRIVSFEGGFKILRKAYRIFSEAVSAKPRKETIFCKVGGRSEQFCTNSQVWKDSWS